LTGSYPNPNIANTDGTGQRAILAINSATVGSINWARVNKAGSNLTEIATRSHTALSDIGTNSHVTIDTHLGLGGTAHGATPVNTFSAIVQRDAFGFFAAGTIEVADQDTDEGARDALARLLRARPGHAWAAVARRKLRPRAATRMMAPGARGARPTRRSPPC
jgi:hypothetical protein